MTYISQVIADGAVGFWELAETSGTASIDQAGNSNGTYGGVGMTLAAANSIPGSNGKKAPTFVANSATDKVPLVAAIQVGDTFTIECWMIVGTTGTAISLLSSNTTGGPQFALDTANPPKILCQKTATSTLVTSTTGVPNDGAWHHLVWTKATTTNHQYLDGVDVTGVVTNASIVNETVRYGIGFNDHSSNQFMSGNLTMVALYPTALNSTQVANHYTLGTTAIPPVSTAAPVVSGTPVEYQALASTAGTWTDDGAPALTYQWQRDNSGGGVYANISAATLPTYTVQAGDYQCNLRCVVTDTDSGGAVSANSNSVGLVTLAQRLGVRIGAT